ncbi:hypothetical protein [Paraburkholderia flagellata]|uniref:hypothetical protein n=1 Tax=Paraburkholderia flagellata TaxID=2883241 RepID=UPI0027E3C21F|nr:hypothetical protein [Paraburkholderia flagellata]
MIAAAVIAICGGVPTKYVSVSYDLFAGTPIYKPEGFATARRMFGFQTTAAFEMPLVESRYREAGTVQS